MLIDRRPTIRMLHPQAVLICGIQGSRMSFPYAHRAQFMSIRANVGTAIPIYSIRLSMSACRRLSV
jgi:hypothetical protein